MATEIKGRVLIYVYGGIEYHAATPGVEIEVIDWDNLQPGETPELPNRYINLASELGLDSAIKFV